MVLIEALNVLCPLFRVFFKRGSTVLDSNPISTNVKNLWWAGLLFIIFVNQTGNTKGSCIDAGIKIKS